MNLFGDNNCTVKIDIAAALNLTYILLSVYIVKCDKTLKVAHLLQLGTVIYTLLIEVLAVWLTVSVI